MAFRHSTELKKRSPTYFGAKDTTARYARQTLAFEALETRQMLALNPSGNEQEMLQLINQLRTDPQGEFARLIVSSNPRQGVNPQITNAINFFNVDMTQLRSALQALTPTAPVIWNETLMGTAAAHNQVILRVDEQTHQAPGEPTLGDRVKAAGYQFSRLGENVFAFTQNVVEGHASFVIDWGNGPGGMQNPAGHRITYMNSELTEVGISVTVDPNTTNRVGPLIVTQDFGKPLSGYTPMAVGAVYRDLDRDGRYDAGDGISGADVTFVGVNGTFRATSLSAGGYQVQLPAGTYTAIARGGGLNGSIVRNGVTSNGSHVFVNFVEGTSDSLPADRFEQNEDFGSGRSLPWSDQTLETLNLHRAGDKDFYRFVSTTNGTAVIDALFSQAEGDVDIQWYDADQRLVSQSIGHANNERLSVSVVKGQTYFLAVSGFQDSLSLNYSLKIDTPEAPPLPAADAQEPNNTSVTAKTIGPNDQRIDGLTLSSQTDIDWFKFTPIGSGPLVVDAIFSQFNGDVDLEVLAADNSLLGESKSSDNDERVTITVQAGLTYFIKLLGKSGDTSSAYSLVVDGPVAVPPTTVADQSMVNAGSPFDIDVLANDRTSDNRPLAQPVLELESSGGGATPAWSIFNNKIRVTAAAGQVGFYSNRYRVKEASGSFSPFTDIRVMVIASGTKAFQNPKINSDVDGDNEVNPVDALQIINLLNQSQVTSLPQGASNDAPFGFVDVNGNGQLEPIDALLVINELNNTVRGEPQTSDLVMMSDEDRRSLQS